MSTYRFITLFFWALSLASYFASGIEFAGEPAFLETIEAVLLPISIIMTGAGIFGTFTEDIKGSQLYNLVDLTRIPLGGKYETELKVKLIFRDGRIRKKKIIPQSEPDRPIDE